MTNEEYQEVSEWPLSEMPEDIREYSFEKIKLDLNIEDEEVLQ